MAAPKLPRLSGRVTNWNDVKGFGWIRPFDIAKPDYWFHATQWGREQATQVLLERA
jgi:cold shock CspA family protein